MALFAAFEELQARLPRSNPGFSRTIRRAAFAQRDGGEPGNASPPCRRGLIGEQDDADSTDMLPLTAPDDPVDADAFIARIGSNAVSSWDSAGQSLRHPVVQLVGTAQTRVGAAHGGERSRRFTRNTRLASTCRHPPRKI
jgi:hypothetical protein